MAPTIWVGGEAMGGYVYPCASLDKAQAAKVPDTHYNARCRGCNGRAWCGIGAIQCEREGGCLATREPADNEVYSHHNPRTKDVTWLTYNTDTDYPTREMAVDAWRVTEIKRMWNRP